MSETDLAAPREFDVDGERGAAEGFRLHQCGFLLDMRRWQHADLRSPFWRCYHHVGTGSAVVSRGRRIALAPGELVLIPENVPFAARGAAGVGHFWFHFSPPVGSELAALAGSGLLRIPIEGELGGLVGAWRGELVRQDPAEAGDRRRLVHLSLALLHAALARVPLPAQPAAGRALREVLEEIERTLAAPPGNGALARRAGRSVEGFIRWFRAGTGMTPARYVAVRRAREAGRLLTLTDRSIDEIAAALGFANRHHFTRLFTRHAGMAPARFREERRG
ncbi:MAG TPA: AraC family transcriptional regulator [Candidatus Methylacidiphilales bacterium]